MWLGGGEVKICASSRVGWKVLTIAVFSDLLMAAMLAFPHGVSLMVLILVVAWLAVEVCGQSSLGTWSEQVQQGWWDVHVGAEDWVREREVIERELLEVFGRLGAVAAFGNPSFAGWARHLKWLSLMPEDQALHPAYEALGRNVKLRGLFLDSLSPYDDQGEAMAVLCRIQLAHSGETINYPELAVALSVVFDQEFPDGWPHHFVERASVLRSGEGAEERFGFYVRSHREGKLALDPARLTVDQLKFVIDSPVPLEELAYLQGVRMRSLQQLQWLFQAIRYDSGRVERGQLMWPHGAYRLFTIQKEGGLCVDQSYFTAHTCKAKGIPSIFFLGQGNSGEHAWVGILDSNGRWDFGVGKIRREHYPVGQAFDPQTWRRLTDAQCMFLFRTPVAAAAKTRARLCHGWAELFPEAEFVGESLRLARAGASSYLWAWDVEADWLEASGAPVERVVAFWEDWVRNFATQDDLRFRGEKRLLNALDETGEVARYERLFGEVVARNRGGRFDLATGLSAERVFALVQSGRWEEADKAFDDALVRLRASAGGHLFYQLIQPYVQSCLEEGRREEAAAALERSAKHFRPQAGSILDRDLAALGRLVR